MLELGRAPPNQAKTHLIPVGLAGAIGFSLDT